ncbi:hypothetical protein ACYX8G_01885 [Microbacterium saperdae]
MPTRMVKVTRPGRLVLEHPLLVLMLDTGRRNICFSAAAIPGHVAMAGWKASLMFVTPSLFILANALFTLGIAGAKTLIVVCDRRERHGSTTAARRAYRTGGILLIVLALAYIASCLPYLLGIESTGEYGYVVALAIATITFVELSFSIHGFFSSRRRGDLLMELNKLGNLGASLILLVLTQTALLSMASTRNHTFYNGLCGVILGSAVVLIGVYMLCRRVPPALPESPGDEREEMP